MRAIAATCVSWFVANGCAEPAPPPEPETPATALASTVCDWVFACQCEVSFADEARCRGAVTNLFELEHGSASRAGLLRDEGCLDALLDDLDFEGCLPRGARPQAPCDVPCQLFHGMQPTGAPCRWHGNYHDCQQGLLCRRQDDGSDLCVDPCPPPLPEGAPCILGAAPDCDAAQDLICIANDPSTGEGTCRHPLQPGEPCIVDGSCVLGTYCDSLRSDEPLCRKYPGLGEPCPPPRRCDYTELLFCDQTDPRAPLCRPLPAQGEPCPAGLCSPGAYCDAAAVCRPSKAAGQRCTSSHECASEQCVEGQCVESTLPICILAERLSPLDPARG